jgi:hypothetical protein
MITIGVRHRKRMGDIEGLARSVDAVELQHPVVIDKDNKLIAGERRIKALQLLGHVKIPVTVVDLAEIVRGEFAENAEREDFTLTEAVAIKQAIEPLLKAEAKARQIAGAKLPKGGAKLAPPLKGKTRDTVAKRTGKKRTTLAKAEKVIAAAAKDPEKFGYLVEQMDETDNPTAALRLINKRTDEARILMLRYGQLSTSSSADRSKVQIAPFARWDQRMRNGPPADRRAHLMRRGTTKFVTAVSIQPPASG